MRALTVRQPWAWAIVHGGKDVENRTAAWSYRGPLAIHAGAAISQRGMDSQLIGHALRDRGHITVPTPPFGGPIGDPFGAVIHRSAVIGIVELVGAHPAHPGCCESPWAEQEYQEAGGRTRRDLAHLVLEDPRPFAVPVPAKGRLGLWTPDPDLTAQIQEALR